MAITYLSGERIQGSSAASKTVDFSDSFTSDNWADTDTHIGVDTGNTRMGITVHRDGSDDKSVYDLGAGNVSETAWVLRYEITWTTINSSDQSYFFTGLSDTVAASNVAADRITAQYQLRATSGQLYIRTSDTDNANLGGTDGDTYAAYDLVASTTYYVTLTRASATSYTIIFRTGSHTGTEVVSITGVVTSSVDNLRYIVFQNLIGNGSGTSVGYIDNVKFYNGITDADDVDEKTTISNVPTGTRYEEVDTRKIFTRYNAVDNYAAGWVEKGTAPVVTWSETFAFASTSGWAFDQTQQSSFGGTVGISSGKFNFTNVSQDFGGYGSKSFASSNTLSDTMWTMLADGTKWTQVSGTPAPLFYGAANQNNDSGGLDVQTGLRFLGALMVGCGGSNTGDHGSHVSSSAHDYSDCWTGNGSGSDNWTTVFRKTATTAQFKSYPTSDRTASADEDDDWTIQSDIINLDRILMCGQSGAGSTDRRATGEILEIRFKSGENDET